MKTFLKIIGGLICVIVLGVAAVFYFTAGMTDTVDEFFAAVQSGEPVDEYLSEGFKKATPMAQLNLFLNQSSLADFQSASWSSRSISGSTGNLEGTVTTASGGSFPLKVSFVKENGAWKILHLTKERAGISDNTPPVVPSGQEQVALIRESMLAISKAINTQDFMTLHRSMSKTWQSQFEDSKLREIFTPFVEQSINLDVVSSMQPEFTTVSELDNRGVLILSGAYPTKPSKVSFKLSYLHELPEWKLIGLSVNVGRQPDVALQDE